MSSTSSRKDVWQGFVDTVIRDIRFALRGLRREMGFAGRVDHAGRSVAISGDIRPSDNLVNFSKGVDV